MKLCKNDAVRIMVDTDGYPVSHYHEDRGSFRASWKKFSIGIITHLDEANDAYRVQFMIGEHTREAWFCPRHVEAYDGIVKAKAKEAYAPSDFVYAPNMGVAKVAIWCGLEYDTPDEYARALDELNTLLRRKLRAWPWGFQLRAVGCSKTAALVWERAA